MTNCRPIAEGMIDAVDRDALAALTDVSIKHKEDPREFDITFVSLFPFSVLPARWSIMLCRLEMARRV